MKFINALLFVFFALSFYAKSAQVNVIAGSASASVNAGTYALQGTGTSIKKWKRATDNKKLDASTLREHLNIIGGSNCIKELARILLAQIPTKSHNTHTNASYNYTDTNYSDIYDGCSELKRHLLINGHLGYFPFIRHSIGENKLSRVETYTPRGIFNIPFRITNRIMKEQRRIAQRMLQQQNIPASQTRAYHTGYNTTDDVIHLLPNIIADNCLPREFEIDPERRGWPDGPNLESVTNGLINKLLSGESITSVTIDVVVKNRFTLSVSYAFPSAIADVTETKNVGYKKDGTETNKVKMVIDVTDGLVRIITMYPED